MKNRKIMIGKCGAAVMLSLALMESQASALTLNEYLEQVRGGNGAVKASTLQAEGAELKGREADLIFTPKLFAEARVGHDKKPGNPQMYDDLKSQYYSLGLSQQFRFGLQTKLYYELSRTEFVGVSPTSPLNPTTYWDAMPKLELALPLWGNGFGRTAVANEEVVRAQNEIDKYSSQAQSAALLANAEAVYWKLAAWEDVVKIQENAKQAAQSILDYVSKKRKMNLGEDADVMQAKALVEARTLELQMAQNERREAQRQFNKFLNRDATAPIEGLEKIDYATVESLTFPKGRPGSRADVLATTAQVRAAKASSTLVEERNKPTLDIYGNYSLTGRNEDLQDALKAAGEDEKDTAFVGVRLNVPLYFTAAADAKKGARKAEQAAELNRQYALYAQEQDWINLAQNLEDARSNLVLLSRIEQAQKSKLETERTRLRQGRTTTYQVLLFEQDYSQAAVSKVKAAVGILSLNAQTKIYQASLEGGH